MAKRVSVPVSTPTITKEMSAEMLTLRQQVLELEVPVKTQADFADENAYREYLLQSYNTLRHKEYEYIVRDETMKVYNLACDSATISNVKNVDNQMVWNGYRQYINAAKTPEEKKRREDQVKNCAMGRAPEIGRTCIGTDGTGFHCCAVSASAITAQISGQMGYDGKDNLLIPVFRGSSPSRRNNIVSAACLSQADSIQEHQNNIPAMLPQKTNAKNKTLNELVRTGELSIGDSFAINMGTGANNTSSGKHAMIIADVIKDDKGNVTSYIIQANNKHCLQEININNKNDYWGSKTVCDIVKTHEFINSKINIEQQDLSKLPLSELEERLNNQRAKTVQAITNLNITEEYNISKNYNKKIDKAYIEELEKYRKKIAENSTTPNEMLGRRFINVAPINIEPIKFDPPSNPEEDKINLHTTLSADANATAKLSSQLLTSNDIHLNRADLFAYFKDSPLSLDPYALIEKYNEDDNLFERKSNNDDKTLDTRQLLLYKKWQKEMT